MKYKIIKLILKTDQNQQDAGTWEGRFFIDFSQL